MTTSNTTATNDDQAAGPASVVKESLADVPPAVDTAVAADGKNDDSIDEDDRDAINKILEGRKENKAALDLIRPEEEALSNSEKAILIQNRLREKRLEKERREAMYAEKTRIEQMKMMAETRRQLEEAEKKRAYEQFIRDKEEKKAAEQRQKDLLRADFRERFGRDMTDEEIRAQQLSKMSHRERGVYFVGRLKSQYQAAGDPAEAAKVALCCKTVKAYCQNLKDHPNEKKYFTIKMSNKAFQERVAPFDDALEVLKAVGFAQVDSPEGPLLQVKTVLPDGFTLGEVLKFLNFIIGQFH